jgi:ABC-2 type transport system permease protein
VRHLLLGGPVAGDALAATAWAVGVALVSYFWARRLYTTKALTIR